MSKINAVRAWFKRKDDVAKRRFISFLRGEGDDALASLYLLFKIAAVLVLTVYGSSLFLNIGSDPGPWGDFIGGTLNPILTFLTFMGLLLTIVIQQNELRQTRDEYRKSSEALDRQNESIRDQSFETTLHGMIALHNQIIEGISHYSVSQKKVVTGRHAFRPMYTMLSDQHGAKRKKSFQLPISEIDIARLAYRGIWPRLQPNLGHYFRYLYNIIKYIKTNSKCPQEHIRIVRAQISDYELLILFYNLLTPQGAKFKELVEEFAILDNMPEHLLGRSHKSFLAPSAFGRLGPPTLDAFIPADQQAYNRIAR